MTRKFKTSFTLSMKCKHLLRLLSERFGISRTGVIEMLVRERVRAEKIDDVGGQEPQDTTASE